MEKLTGFKNYLKEKGKSKNTIKGYTLDVRQYINWFMGTCELECTKLYRENIQDYISYLKTVKRQNAKTINHKLSSLSKYNEYLIEKEIQEDLVIKKSDMIKIQTEYASPTKVSDLEVKQFLQKVLESENRRNYSLFTLLAYTGLRISEALSIKIGDFNLKTGECIIRNGKGEKQRIVLLNNKVINSLREYLKEREEYLTSSNSDYLFISRKRDRLDRTSVNRIAKQFSNKITPHQLRHYFCTNALEKGFSIHEVANQAGHSNINTTLIYTNPDKDKLRKKMELL